VDAANFSISRYRKEAPSDKSAQHPCDSDVLLFSPRLIATVMLWIMGYGTCKSVHAWASEASALDCEGGGNAAKSSKKDTLFRITQWRHDTETTLWQNWNPFCAMVRDATVRDYASIFPTINAFDDAEESPSGEEGPAKNPSEEEGDDEEGAQAGSGEEDGRRRAAKQKVRTSERHNNNIADMRPCMSAADCEIFPCDNVIRSDLVGVKMCPQLMADPSKDEAVYNVQRGLFSKRAPIPKGAWVASFGPVVSNDGAMQDVLGYAVQVTRGRLHDGGHWSRKVEMVTPVMGWQSKFAGPYVNHTCCIHHLNAEFVSTEDYGNEEGAPMSTVNVRMTKDVPEARQRPYNEAGYYICPEILVNYGPDYERIVGTCRCCAHTQKTLQCRFV
jgi:hypothetical protein